MGIPSNKIIIIAGPTASGKSAHALSLAQKHDGVIINADSMQVYRDLHVLTARPSPEDEQCAPHRLYGVIDGAERCSAMRWQAMADEAIQEAWAGNQTPIVVGGTGLYLNALVHGMSPIPDVPDDIRQAAMGLCDNVGPVALHGKLAEVDAVTAAKLEPGDSQRITRAWEVWCATGKPISHWQSQPAEPIYARDIFHIIRIDLPREALYARCETRFEGMLDSGAVGEVEQLLERQLSPDLPVMRVIGVPEIAGFIRGESSYEDAASLARQHTRNYAKRQLTWLRNQLDADEVVTVQP